VKLDLAKLELALVLALAAAMLLGALYLATLLKTYGRPERLLQLPEPFVPAVAEFLFMQVFVLLVMISFAAGQITYADLTVHHGVREEIAALASIGVAALAWLAELLLLKLFLTLGL